MSRSLKLRFLAATAFVVIGSFASLNSEIAAQTTRKNKSKTGTAKGQPTPTPVQSIPEIISRAEDLQNDNQVVESLPAPPQNVENPVDASDKTNNRIKELNARVKNLEATKKDPYEEKQKRLLLNLDILTRAEQRAETLRKQMFEIIEKESAIRTRLDNIESDIRPEIIERQVAFSGSLRPEELRDQRRKSLENEKRNLQNLLTDIQNTRTSLETNVQKADQLVEKLRFKLEKDIDDALADDTEQ